MSVENKPGGGGAVALAALAQRTGGSTLMINAPTMLNNQITGKSPLPYTDFTALAILGIEYECVAVRADSPLKSAKELVERLKKDPSALSVSIGTSLGNAGHLAYALAMKAAGVDIKKLKTVAFNSAGDGITALLGGHIDLASTPPSAVLQHVQAGKLRVLVLTAPTRSHGELANVPTWKELGINSTHEVWRGIDRHARHDARRRSPIGTTCSASSLKRTRGEKNSSKPRSKTYTATVPRPRNT